MKTSGELSDFLARTLESEVAALRAIPEGPATARPNRPAGTGWSMREELGHLVDSAVNNHNRIVRAALDGAYEGPGYDENPWVDLHRYRERPWETLVGEWHAHNTILVPLVANVPDARLSSPCRVGTGEPVTLAFLIEDYVLHMKHHLDQIHRRPVVTRYPGARRPPGA